MGSACDRRLIWSLGLAAAALAIGWARTAPRYSFRGKAVLMTGGSRGFGLVMARRLGAEGARLFLIARTDEQLRAAERELRASGIDVHAWPCDVRDPSAVEAIVARVVRKAGRIDVLINNAGIIQASPFDHTTTDDYADSLQTHFWGPLYAIRAALPYMRRQRSGRILNISSIGGRLSVPHLIPYGVGKAALAALSDGVRAEVAQDGIRVTTAAPGLMRTGSHLNVEVRGQHRREAQLFGLMVATPLTSMDAERAARQVLEACRRGDAQVTTGWQAKLATRANALAPEVMAGAMAAAVRWLLPGPTSSPMGNAGRYAWEIDLGWVSALLPRRAAVRNNEAPPLRAAASALEPHRA